MMGEILAADPAVTCDGLTGAARQARYRERQRRQGLVAVTVVVPVAATSDLVQAAEAMRSAPHLTFGPLRDPLSGKLVSSKNRVARKPAVIDDAL
jgi:hypothetical protein